MKLKKLRPIEQEQRPSKRKLILKCSVVIFVLVTILEIWLVNRLSTYGEKLSQIKLSQAILITQNQILENKLAKASSLNDLEKTATQLGFVESQSIDYLKPQAVASR